MPVFRLTRQLFFPSVELAEPNGLLAVGGDLRVSRLLLAYRQGIFPWYSEGEPLLWWSPDPRFVLLPERFHVPQGVRRFLRRHPYTVTLDRDFRRVMMGCAGVPRRGRPGTWITAAMLDAYTRLHEEGYAHSVEVWSEGRLAGGLYGVALGRCFFGESMFTVVSGAGHVALASLVGWLRREQFRLIDSQVHTAHLERVGAELIPRARYLALLTEALRETTLRGSWSDWPHRYPDPVGEVLAPKDLSEGA